MIVFCDTSGFYAAAIPEDRHHRAASALWKELIGNDRFRLVTTNYVAVESIAIFQKRSGLSSIQTFNDSIVGVVEVAFVDSALHELALSECLHANKRHVSLVDHVSFAFMQRYGIRAAFAFDEHFTERGFKLPSLR